jgi:hypothetical protein
MNGWTNRILWLVYLALLGVLLPHTAWAFNHFEPIGIMGTATAWAAAFAFEAAIATFTHKLARHIEKVPQHKDAWLRWRKRYLNAYSVGLVLAMGISALANLAHAVQFGVTLAIFGEWGIPFAVYAVAFGGILPLCSLLFARVLSNVAEAEAVPNEELDAAKATIRELRSTLRTTEQRAQAAEQRFDAIGDLAARLFASEKRQRILAAYQRWPELPTSTIAVITESSPSYVSEILKETELVMGEG